MTKVEANRLEDLEDYLMEEVDRAIRDDEPSAAQHRCVEGRADVAQDALEIISALLNKYHGI